MVDGRVEVVESWLGDAEPGTELTIDALAHYGSEEHREVVPSPYQMAKRERAPVGRVTGHRMVLFLDRDSDGALRLVDTVDNGAKSVAWLEAGLAFGRIQMMNPGGNGIRPTGTTAVELREQAERTVALRDALGLIEAFPDPLTRVMAVAPHCHEDGRLFLQERAFEIIAASGPSGAGYLRSVALDERQPNLNIASRAIRTLAQFSPETSVPTLLQVLENELEYWTKVELPESWWSATEPSHQARDYRRSRYGRMTAALRALNELNKQDLSPTLTTVSALKSLWETRPELLEISNSNVLRLSHHILTKADK